MPQGARERGRGIETRSAPGCWSARRGKRNSRRRFARAISRFQELACAFDAATPPLSRAVASVRPRGRRRNEDICSRAAAKSPNPAPSLFPQSSRSRLQGCRIATISGRDDALAADPMLQEANNPLLGNFREERSDVGVEYVVHFLAADSDDHCIQRIVLAAVWPKSIREPEEILLVDRAQHRCHCSLDDFVFERRDRERALASVFLRNVAPTGR